MDAAGLDKLAIQNISGRAARGFRDADAPEGGADGFVQCQLIENGLSHNLCRRILTGEQVACVEAGVVEAFDHLGQTTFSRDEIDHEPACVQLLARERSRHVPIVPVNGFERTVGQMNLMSSTERCFN